MRFLADENVHADVIRGLRQTNHEVQDIVEVVNRETEILSAAKPLVVVLSENGYRIRKPGMP